MKPLANRIRDAAKKYKIARDIIELDYAISYLLTGIFTQDKLRETLVFKGGTALKKLYFGEYRFSEDLDFPTRNTHVAGTLEDNLAQAKNETENLLQQYGQFSINIERYVEKNPHPEGQEAFIYRVTFPWHNEPLCRLKVEITHNEQVLDAPLWRQLIHGYEEDLSTNILCLSLEEIVVEKMRSLLQTRKKFQEGKNRPRPRDFYDLWSIMKQFGNNLNKVTLESLLKPKCNFRKVYYNSLDDFFDANTLNEAGKYWKTNLGRLIANLPEFNEVIDDLKGLIPKFFPSLNL